MICKYPRVTYPLHKFASAADSPRRMPVAASCQFHTRSAFFDARGIASPVAEDESTER